MTTEELKDTNIELIEFSTLWSLLMGEPLPSSHQFLTWRSLHTNERLFVAIAKTSTKNQTMTKANQEFTLDHKIKTVSEIANRIKDEQELKEKTSDKK